MYEVGFKSGRIESRISQPTGRLGGTFFYLPADCCLSAVAPTGVSAMENTSLEI
jgi:hypothetical protein